MPDRNITFEIREYLGTIAKYDTNWRKELNIVSWNGGTPKFDIRDWDEQHVKMSKGITLSTWEMRKVIELYFAHNNERTVARGRAREEERNALRAAPYRRRDTSEFDDGSADESFETEETIGVDEAFVASTTNPQELSVENQIEMGDGKTAEDKDSVDVPVEISAAETSATEENQEEPF